MMMTEHAPQTVYLVSCDQRGEPLIGVYASLPAARRAVLGAMRAEADHGGPEAPGALDETEWFESGHDESSAAYSCEYPLGRMTYHVQALPVQDAL